MTAKAVYADKVSPEEVKETKIGEVKKMWPLAAIVTREALLQETELITIEDMVPKSHSRVCGQCLFCLCFCLCHTNKFRSRVYIIHSLTFQLLPSTKTNILTLL